MEEGPLQQELLVHKKLLQEAEAVSDYTEAYIAKALFCSDSWIQANNFLQMSGLSKLISQARHFCSQALK